MTQKLKKNDGGKVVLDEAEVKSVLAAQPDFLVPLVQEAVQTILEVEMEECLQAGKHERSEQRLGYRSGYYQRRLITGVGTLVLRVPQDRAGQFSTQVFEQYQRSEKALVAALAQMYVQGVSTRKVRRSPRSYAGTRLARRASARSRRGWTNNSASSASASWHRSFRMWWWMRGMSGCGKAG